MSKTVGRPFEPGRSGNPGGRPREAADLRVLARAHAPEAINALVGIMKSKKASPSAVVAAAIALLDRGYGKPCLTAYPDEPPPATRDESISVKEAARILGAMFMDAKRQLDDPANPIEP